MDSTPVLASGDCCRGAFIEALLDDLQVRVASGLRPVLGINGPVGAGKSTLVRELQRRAQGRGLALGLASIDDAYRPWSERQRLLAGNPFGVTRVPPGSHDPQVLIDALAAWRQDPQSLVALPRFDKTARGGEGDRVAPWSGHADAVLLEGWLLGCRALALESGALRTLAAHGDPGLAAAELQWLPHWNRQLEAYHLLWDQLDQLVVLWPSQWEWPRRWRFQAEARQRRRCRQGSHGHGGWLEAPALDAIVRSSLASLPAALYQQPLLRHANRVMVLDRRRRCLWQGPGYPALFAESQASSPSSSATG